MYKSYGQDNIIQSLRDELKREGSSLILYGPPGIGKTRILRTFYEELLENDNVIAGFSTLYPEIEPFSCLFAASLASLFNNLDKKNRKTSLRDIAGSIRFHLGEGMGSPSIKDLLLHIKGHLLRCEFREIVRLAECLWDEKGLPELSLDLYYCLKPQDVENLMKAFRLAISPSKVVFILDDFGFMRETREDIFDRLLTYSQEGVYLYFALEQAYGLNSRELGRLSKDGVKEWLEKEDPNLLRSFSLKDLYEISEGDPFVISEWIKQDIKGRASQILEDRGLGLMNRLLSGYDRKMRCQILKIALTRSPLSISECAKLLDVDEDYARHRVFQFENDFLLARSYLEGEGLFSIEHTIKRDQIISIMREEFDLDGLYRELAAHFEREISYPMEEDMAHFWTSLKNVLYYYGLLKDEKAREAYRFYQRLITILRSEGRSGFDQSIQELLEDPYFRNLATRLRIILYAKLAMTRMDKPELFKESLDELNRSVSAGRSRSEYLIEYAKALFYLANYISKQECKRILDLLIKDFSTLVYQNPEIEEIKIIYSHALYNLAYDFARIQEFDGARNTIEALAALMHRNPDTPEIKTEYTKAVANISSRLGQSGRFKELSDYLERLEPLVESRDDVIRIEYARALTNLSFHLGESGRFDQLNNLIDKLKRLFDTSPDVIEVKIAYAKALANASAALSGKGDFEKSNGLIEALATLTVSEGKKSSELNGVYISSLFNLSSDLGRMRRFSLLMEVLGRMKEIVLSGSWNEEVILAYAKTLYNASYDLGKSGRFKELFANLSILDELQRQDSQPEVELIYIETIFNAVMDLARAKDYREMSRLLTLVKGLSCAEFKNPETMKVFARALFNLVSYLGENRQFKIMKEVLNLLTDLSKRGTEPAKVYRNALLNATIYIGKERDLETLSEIIEEMERSLTIDGGEPARLAYAKLLVNASGQLGKAGLFDKLMEIIEKGGGLVKENPADLRVKEAYLDILVNAAASLAKRENLDDLRRIVERLKNMNDLSEGDGTVATAFSKALVILGDELERRGELVELNRVMATLEDLARESPQVVAFLQTIDFPLV